MAYGEIWKAHRAMFTKYFRPQAVSRYHPRMRKELDRFLQALLDSPDEFYHHIHL